MRYFRFALALFVVLGVAQQGFAQVKWVVAPGPGTKAKTISVNGLITRPALGWAPGDVTIECWGAIKTDATLLQEPPLVIKKAALVDNGNGTWTFGPADAPVSGSGVDYNVVANVPFYSSLNVYLGTYRTQGVIAKSK
jgi:hypothetical protein